MQQQTLGALCEASFGDAGARVAGKGSRVVALQDFMHGRQVDCMPWTSDSADHGNGR